MLQHTGLLAISIGGVRFVLFRGRSDPATALGPRTEFFPYDEFQDFNKLSFVSGLNDLEYSVSFDFKGIKRKPPQGCEVFGIVSSLGNAHQQSSKILAVVHESTGRSAFATILVH